MQKPTIKYVAKEANVSIATVSRILNNGVGYSEKTKKLVLETIQQMGYSPNAIARGLINKQSNTIGVLMPEISGLVSADILQGIEKAAHSQGQSVIVCNTAPFGNQTMDYLKLLQEKQVDGLLFTSQFLTTEHSTYIKQMDVPAITISAYSNDKTIPAVRVDDEQAAYDAVQYLIKRGHRHIGMISGSPDDPLAGSPRINGYKKALYDHHIEYDDSKIAWRYGFYFEDGREACSTLLQKHPNLTAIFAASDELASGAIAACYESGLSIPKDLSLVGYDGTKLSKMTHPALTTVSQHFVEMGETAVNLLLKPIQDTKYRSGAIIQHQIIERASVRTIN
ncbi:LacI family DNA-binding transcriptional regulator [Shouchella miscanthi]|uniref:Substrate-binding domain-containing protein n=1 Tax=Shouchella miscanthi TaxID=2598861 RepID=A0ABU6NN43_9BACI|nr:substrate-binding domain-containing protein [Shouchella miscanthi]